MLGPGPVMALSPSTFTGAQAFGPRWNSSIQTSHGGLLSSLVHWRMLRFDPDESMLLHTALAVAEVLKLTATSFLFLVIVIVPLALTG